MERNDAPAPDWPSVRADIFRKCFAPNSTPFPPATAMDDIAQAQRMSWVLIPVKGKAPYTRDWPNHPGLPPVKARARVEGSGNVAVLCGERSGRLFVVDIDGDTIPEGFPETVTVQTGGGGFHLYYLLPEGVELENPNKCGKVGEGIDIRYTGGVAVYPGSVHPETGAFYEFVAGKSPDAIPLSEVPAWVIEALQTPKKPPRKPQERRTATTAGNNPAYSRKALEGACDDVASAMPGKRNNTLFQKASRIGGLVATGELAESEVFDALLAAAPIVADFPESEARATIHSGLEKGKATPWKPPARTAPQNTDSTALFHLDVAHDLPVDELFRRIPASGHKNAGTAVYHDAISICIANRELTGTIGDTTARLDDAAWRDDIDLWAEIHNRDPLELETAVGAYWPTSAGGHPSPRLAGVWAFRKAPEATPAPNGWRSEWRWALTLCCRFQQVHGSDPFHLSDAVLSHEILEFAQILGERCRFSRETARHTLKRFVNDGLLKVARKGNTRRSTRYHFTGKLAELQSYRVAES